MQIAPTVCAIVLQIFFSFSLRETLHFYAQNTNSWSLAVRNCRLTLDTTRCHTNTCQLLTDSQVESLKCEHNVTRKKLEPVFFFTFYSLCFSFKRSLI